MADDDWRMGELAAQDSYMPPEQFAPSNVIDRRSFVPDKPFEQPSDEEMFQYELMRNIKMNRDLSGSPADPIPPLERQPAPTGDDELDDARGGLRPLTREELDAFQAQMMADRPTAREEAMMGQPYDPWGMRKSVEDKLNEMALERQGYWPRAKGSLSDNIRSTTPQSDFDDELRVMRGYERPGLTERIMPQYPIETFDVGRRR
jgi:hypothetical protein